jgi:hypothetical protein
MTSGVVPARAHKHAGFSQGPALMPRAVSIKRSLLRRMELRQADLSWAAREALDTFARCKAKVLAIDDWLEGVPLIDENGDTPLVVSKIYFQALRAQTSALAELRALVAASQRTDSDMLAALRALDDE